MAGSQPACGPGLRSSLPCCHAQDPAARAELVKGLHLLKTDIFMEMVESGAMPLRPGVARLVNEAISAGEAGATVQLSQMTVQ